MRSYLPMRVSKLRSILAQKQWDGFLVSHSANLLYLTGFSGSSGLALVDQDSVTLFTDSRYATQVKEQAGRCKVKIAHGPLLDAVAEVLRGRRGLRIGFEASHLAVAEKSRLSRRAGSTAVSRWVPSNAVIEQLRSKKDAAEIRVLRASARAVCRVLAEVLPQVRPGVREVELAAELEHRMRRLGAQGPSFETIVASGPRSALPHARPTTRKLRKSELVVLDLGVILGHYCSDLTRTVYLGKAPRRVTQWYDATREAHEAAAAALRPGVSGRQVDEAARAVFRRHGIEQLFIHSCGHGLGLEIHEEPRLSRGSQTRLQAGNVVTIEPGLYEEGTGGIRIEDDYLVTPHGAERLTRTCLDVFAV